MRYPNLDCLRGFIARAIKGELRGAEDRLHRGTQRNTASTTGQRNGGQCDGDLAQRGSGMRTADFNA